MKWLAGTLLVLNIMLFAWGTFHGDSSTVQQTIDPPIGNLKLVSELEAEASRIEESIRLAEDKAVEEKRKAEALLEAARQKELATMAAKKKEENIKAKELLAGKPTSTDVVEQQQSKSVIAKPEQQAVVQNCRTMGPFAKIEDAKKVAFQLASGGVAAKTRTSVKVDREGYWVLIPSEGSIADGKLQLKKLASAGVDDTWLFRKGEMKGSISLGLFSREKNAKRRANAVRSKGFDAIVQPKSSEKTTVWLDFYKPRQNLPVNFIKGLENKYKGLKYTKKACRKK